MAAKKSKFMQASDERSKRGRPAYKPTERDREQVYQLVGRGQRAEDVCAIMGFSRATLFKYFPDEIKAGRSISNASVANKAYDMAMSGKFPAMTMFWLKTQAGWRETQAVTIDDLPAINVNLAKDGS